MISVRAQQSSHVGMNASEESYLLALNMIIVFIRDKYNSRYINTMQKSEGCNKMSFLCLKGSSIDRKMIECN
jgi:hypothetical protein